MTPASRLQAAIELLDLVLLEGRPADQVAGEYFRSRRYIGAKDRRAVAETLYGVLRRRAALDWWLARVAGSREPMAATGRSRILAALALVEGWSAERISAQFDGGHHHPASLEKTERVLLRGLEHHTLEHPEQPAWVRYELPAWLYDKLAALFGPCADRELRALQAEAPVDIRVNALKVTREEARAALAAEGIAAEPTRFSPLGLRLGRRAGVSASRSFRDGLVEIQDEGSQLVALLVDVRSGHRVCDFCAGAGGKTLALAAAMGNRGQIVALDIRAPRLERAGLRLRRAGVHNVTRRALASHRDPWVKRHKGSFDRVLVDAPCTGCGTWRRNPDAKWRIRPEDLAELAALQAEILDSAARLVRPGGRLVYATCSLLPEENESQIGRFRAAHPEFRLVPIAESWTANVGGACPTAGETLMLTPAEHETDGFFVAVLERG